MRELKGVVGELVRKEMDGGKTELFKFLVDKICCDDEERLEVIYSYGK